MGITILAPELVTGKAVADLISALQCKKTLAAWATQDGVDFGLVHAFLADMGGFALRFPSATSAATDATAATGSSAAARPKADIPKSSGVPGHAPQGRESLH